MVVVFAAASLFLLSFVLGDGPKRRGLGIFLLILWCGAIAAEPSLDSLKTLRIFGATTINTELAAMNGAYPPVLMAFLVMMGVYGWSSLRPVPAASLPRTRRGTHLKGKDEA
jgi:hypothetical protein